MSPEKIDYLSVEDLLEIAVGVVDEVGVRDAGLLAAAAGRPAISVFGENAYGTFEDKAGALMHSLVRTHALVDGNKRLAWSTVRVFFLLNDRDLIYTVAEAEELILNAAAGRMDVQGISAWLTAHLRPTS